MLLDLLDHPAAQPSRRASAADVINRARMDRVLDHIRRRYERPMTAATLARLVDVSTPHLTRLFRRHCGCAPVEYLRRHRIDVARALLADPWLSIKQVAHRVGFDDPSHFSRVFTRIDGLSPSLFRSAALPGS